MKYQKGDVYQTKTGEIIEVGEFSAKDFKFIVWHPETMVRTAELSGPLEKLSEFWDTFEPIKINPQTHAPTGLRK